MTAPPPAAPWRHKTAMIGLLGSVGDELANRILDGMLAYAAAHPGLSVHDMRTHVDADAADRVSLAGMQGVIVTALCRRPATAVAGRLAGVKLPIVAIGLGSPPGIVAAIEVDRAACAAVAVAHLAARRCRSFLSVGSADCPGADAWNAAIQSLAKGVVNSYACPHHLRGGIDDVPPLLEDRRFAALLERLPRPIGVLCQDDIHAAAVVRASGRMGLVTPGDIAIIGVGDTSLARYATPPITSIRLPCEAIGARAMGILARCTGDVALAGKSSPPGRPQSVSLRVEPGDLIPRESTVGHRADDHMARHWLAYVRGRADRGVTVSQMAAELSVPRRRFERQFTRLVGRSPSVELQRIRIDRAMQLLADPLLTVTEVGIRLGFAESASFSRFFRNHAGKSPREYRQQALAADVGRPPKRLDQ